MRNQIILFLGLFGMTLAAGCTITTTDDLGKGGSAGDDDGTGGKQATGGTSSAGGTSSTGGTTATAGAAGTTTPAFTSAQCATAAATVPASAPDVTPTCINCIYTTACSQAVACHNDGNCMSSTLKALECIRLYFVYNSIADAESVQACQEGKLTNASIPTDAATAVPNQASTDPGAWLGAEVPAKGTAVVAECPVECNLAD